MVLSVDLSQLTLIVNRETIARLLDWSANLLPNTQEIQSTTTAVIKVDSAEKKDDGAAVNLGTPKQKSLKKANPFHPLHCTIAIDLMVCSIIWQILFTHVYQLYFVQVDTLGVVLNTPKGEVASVSFHGMRAKIKQRAAMMIVEGELDLLSVQDCTLEPSAPHRYILDRSIDKLTDESSAALTFQVNDQTKSKTNIFIFFLS